MNLNRLISHVSTTVTEIVVAYLLALLSVGPGVDAVTLARIVLAIKLNLFAVPLSWTPALRLPLWVWYVIAVVWIQQWWRLTGATASEVVEDIDHYLSTEVHETQPVAADGGEKDAEP
ncbi:hypothetical protein [Haloarcula sediminis]|uniref:hypothetical protein n=1 Tax=Haloarcula sediminis TaxID=3111777 RepID=UPI002D77CE09|nr:hypothetical protein [Haloarcula sp. CK38]